MNVISRALATPSADLSVGVTSHPMGFTSSNAPVGYASAVQEVNASDRPQDSKGQCSSGAVTATNATTEPEALTPQEPAPQKSCFRGDLTSPYGHILF